MIHAQVTKFNTEILYPLLFLSHLPLSHECKIKLNQKIRGGYCIVKVIYFRINPYYFGLVKYVYCGCAGVT